MPRTTTTYPVIYKMLSEANTFCSMCGVLHGPLRLPLAASTRGATRRPGSAGQLRHACLAQPRRRGNPLIRPPLATKVLQRTDSDQRELLQLSIQGSESVPDSADRGYCVTNALESLRFVVESGRQVARELTRACARPSLTTRHAAITFGVDL